MAHAVVAVFWFWKYPRAFMNPNWWPVTSAWSAAAAWANGLTWAACVCSPWMAELRPDLRHKRARSEWPTDQPNRRAGC